MLAKTGDWKVWSEISGATSFNGNRPLKTIEDQVYMMDGVNLTDQLSRVTVKTLVIHGDKDVLVSPWYSMQMADILPFATLKQVSGSHYPTTDILVSEINQFLKH